MNEQEEKELIGMTRYILSSKTKYAKELCRLISFYHDNLDKAQPLPANELRLTCSSSNSRNTTDALDNCLLGAREATAQLKKLEKMTRNLYEDRTGQKWRPSLRVVQGGGNTSPITRKVTRHKKPLS